MSENDHLKKSDEKIKECTRQRLEDSKDLRAVIESTSKKASSLFLAQLSLCMYSLLTLAGTKDTIFLISTERVRLPFVNVEIEPLSFFIAAPLFVLALNAYLTFYLFHLRKLLRRLQSMPAPEGGWSSYVHPWLFNLTVVHDKKPLPRSRWLEWLGNKLHEKPVKRWKRNTLRLLDLYATVRRKLHGTRLFWPFFTGAAIWLLPLFTNWYFTWRYSARHDNGTIGLCLICVLTTGVFLVSESVFGSREKRVKRIAVLILFLLVLSYSSMLSFNQWNNIYFKEHVFEFQKITALIKVLERENRCGKKYEEIGNVCKKVVSDNELFYILYGRYLTAKNIKAKETKLAIFPSSLDLKAKFDIYNELNFEAIPEKPDEAWEKEYEARRNENLKKADDELIKGIDLRSRKLHFANFSKANLRKADLRYADLQGANLWAANLQGANLSSANLQGAFLRDANLQDVDLVFADLQGANLMSTLLLGADLYEANLQGAMINRGGLNSLRPEWDCERWASEGNLFGKWVWDIKKDEMVFTEEKCIDPPSK